MDYIDKSWILGTIVGIIIAIYSLNPFTFPIAAYGFAKGYQIFTKPKEGE